MRMALGCEHTRSDGLDGSGRDSYVSLFVWWCGGGGVVVVWWWCGGVVVVVVVWCGVVVGLGASS